MFLVSLMQYTFLASIAFDVAVAVWFVRQSRHFQTNTIRLYYLTLGIIIAWEIVTYISFFLQLSTSFNFIFNASTFSLGLASISGMLYFTWHFFEKRYLPRQVVWSLLVLTLLTMISAYVPHLMVGEKVFSGTSQLFYLTNAPLTTPFYCLILLQFLTLLGLLLYCYRYSTERKKQEARIMLIGFGTAATAGIVTYVLVPLLVKSFLQSSDMIALSIAVQQIIGGIFVSVLSVAMAYAVLRYRIFDIHYQLKRAALITTLYLVGLVTLGSILLTVVEIFGTIMSRVVEVSILIIFSSAILYLRHLISRVVCKIFPQMILNTYQLTSVDRSVVNSLPSSDQFVRAAVSRFIQHLPVERLLLYTYDPRSLCFTSIYPNTNEKIAVEEPWLIALEQGRINDEILHILRDLNCVKLLPIAYQNQTIAILGLGQRIDEQNFSPDDETYIEQFSKFMAYNLWNYLHLLQFVYNAIDKR